MGIQTSRWHQDKASLETRLKPVNERKFPLDTAGFPEFRQTVHFIGFQVCFLFDFLGKAKIDGCSFV